MRCAPGGSTQLQTRLSPCRLTDRRAELCRDVPWCAVLCARVPRLVLAQNKKELLTNWWNEGKLEASEDLGDLVSAAGGYWSSDNQPAGRQARRLGAGRLVRVAAATKEAAKLGRACLYGSTQAACGFECMCIRPSTQLAGSAEYERTSGAVPGACALQVTRTWHSRSTSCVAPAARSSWRWQRRETWARFRRTPGSRVAPSTTCRCVCVCACLCAC